MTIRPAHDFTNAGFAAIFNIFFTRVLASFIIAAGIRSAATALGQGTRRQAAREDVRSSGVTISRLIDATNIANFTLCKGFPSVVVWAAEPTYGISIMVRYAIFRRSIFRADASYGLISLRRCLASF